MSYGFLCLYFSCWIDEISLSDVSHSQLVIDIDLVDHRVVKIVLLETAFLKCMEYSYLSIGSLRHA